MPTDPDPRSDAELLAATRGNVERMAACSTANTSPTTTA
jgi:hypothetical protein